MTESDGLRQRRRGAEESTTMPDSKGSVKAKSEQTPRSEQDVDDDDDERITLTDVFRMLMGLALLSCLTSFFVTHESFIWGYKPWITRPNAVKAWWRGPMLLTDAELALYDGTDPSLPILLALNGTIYDVTAGRHTYAPGGSYHVFAGKDAARGFVTGCFAEDATPDLRGAEWTYVPVDVPAFGEKVTAEQKTRRERELRVARNLVRDTIRGWQKTFSGETGKDYFKVGKVIRQDRWLEALPLRKLCEMAEQKRPTESIKATDAGKEYRQGRKMFQWLKDTKW